MDYRQGHGCAIEDAANFQSGNSESFVNENSGPVPVNQDSLSATNAVASHNEDLEGLSEPNKAYQIPVVMFSDGMPGSTKLMQPCRRYLTGEGCPFGVNCIYLHDELPQERQSDAICLVSGTDGGGGSEKNVISQSGTDGGGGSEKNVISQSSFKPSKLRTKPCRNWERSQYCPYGDRCLFIHRAPEMFNDNGGLVNQDVKDYPMRDKAHAPSRKLHSVIHNSNAREKATCRWKGPDKISKIYGDWIDDL